MANVQQTISMEQRQETGRIGRQASQGGPQGQRSGNQSQALNRNSTQNGSRDTTR